MKTRQARDGDVPGTATRGKRHLLAEMTRRVFLQSALFVWKHTKVCERVRVRINSGGTLFVGRVIIEGPIIVRYHLSDVDLSSGMQTWSELYNRVHF